eukprot:364000-Chlamydomonas_euryale.AAC.4
MLTAPSRLASSADAVAVSMRSQCTVTKPTCSMARRPTASSASANANAWPMRRSTTPATTPAMPARAHCVDTSACMCVWGGEVVHNGVNSLANAAQHLPRTRMVLRAAEHPQGAF